MVALASDLQHLTTFNVCGIVHKARGIIVSTGSGNSLFTSVDLTITKFLWHSFQSNVFLNAQNANLQIIFEMYTSKFTSTSPGKNELILLIEKKMLVAIDKSESMTLIDAHFM